MPKPLPPAIVSPATGTRSVDAAAPVVVVLDAYRTGLDLYASTANVTLPAKNLEDGGSGPPCWSQPGYLVTADGSRNQMAYAGATSQANKVNWRDNATLLSDPAGAQVLAANAYMRAFTDGSKGRDQGVWVGLTAEYEAIRQADYYYMSRDAWGAVPGTTVTDLIGNEGFRHGLALGELLTQILGPGYTVGQLRALLLEADPRNPSVGAFANLRACVRPESFFGYLPLTWYASTVAIKVSYSLVTPDHQGAIQLRVTSTGSPGGALVWDSGEIYGTQRLAVIPPGVLAAGATYYLWARRQNDLPTPLVSDWSDGSTFTTLAAAASRIIHATGSELARVYTLDWGLWLDEARCFRRIASPTTTWVYATTINRASLPIGNWWISGFVEAGVDKGYTEVYSVADVEATPGSFFYDEAGSVGEGADMLFFRTTTGAGPAGIDGAGVLVLLSQPVSDTRGVKCGPGNRFVADAIVTDHPSLTMGINDVSSDAYQTPSGELILWNGDGRYDRAFAETDFIGNASIDAFCARHRRIRCALVEADGQTPWEQRLPLFDGLFSWGDPLHDLDHIRLRVHGREKQDETLSFSVEGVAFSVPTSTETVPESVGPCAGLAAVWIGGNVWKVGRNITAVNAWYVNGVVQPTSRWSFDPAAKVVTDTTGAVTEAKRTFDGSGEASTSKAPTDLAKLVLLRSGYRASDIIDATFDRIRDTAPPEGKEADGGIDFETDGLELIAVLEATGGFHVCRRQDGTVVATRYAPDSPDAYTLWLFERDLLEVPVSSFNTEGMSEFIYVRYWSIAAGVRTPIDVANRLPAAVTQFGTRRKVDIITAHTTEGGQIYTRQQMRPGRPRRMLEVTVPRTGILGFPGGTAVVVSSRGMSPTDGALAFDLHKIMQVSPVQGLDKVNLALQWVKRLDGTERPF